MDTRQRDRLTHFCQTLVNQEQARIIVAPNRPASGFWFGGGNMVEDSNGVFYLVGRYRNAGDSRTGLGTGERGMELAIFSSTDRGQSFSKVLSFSKSDLDVGDREVLSIEGAALHLTGDGVELFVSTEKSNVGYPAGMEEFQKPGTGVWSIDYLEAPSIEALRQAEVKPLLQTADPRFLHIKDPVVYDRQNGDLVLVFCTHPFSWTSSNSAYAVRRAGNDCFEPPVFDFFPRGVTWDVAMSRITCLLDVPRVGAFAEADPLVMAFYDGGESMRQYEEHARAVRRPRGYSCEEIGGAAVLAAADLSHSERLSRHTPLFISPQGTGCSRYVDVLRTEEGFYVTWQQSQPDESQPLVMNFVPWQVAGSRLQVAGSR
jgi:hypothetical protein